MAPRRISHPPHVLAKGAIWAHGLQHPAAWLLWNPAGKGGSVMYGHRWKRAAFTYNIYIYIYAHNYLSINPSIYLSIYLNIVHTYHTLYINIHKIQRHIEAPSSRPRLGGNTSHSPAPAHHLSSHPHLGCWEIHQWTKRGKQWAKFNSTKWLSTFSL